ncbi:MAG: hypothetical protein IJR94_00205 [Synergistaceae bacterium]|nr:hypothetical protein [Synergistaceae bacterium]
MKSSRKKIDWDAEIQKTEKIKRKGFLMSGVSFAAACALILGMSRATGASIEIPRALLVAVCFVVSAAVFRIIFKKRNLKKEEK